ncbi:hypothetical protein [Kitasatospora sp. NPDC050543]|uniref:hypothetical protein n=1 Tax=Kitasatospora sp. NPDC050543 TaxID=3364054 RepID=UPI0037981139
MRIDPAKVTAVLLADGWHHLDPGSLEIGSGPFEGTWFTFTEAPDATKRVQLSGPVSSIVALTSEPSVTASIPEWCGGCNGGYPTAKAAERWVDTGLGMVRCPDCNPHAGARPAGGSPAWCGRCDDTSARWLKWRYEKDGTPFFQSIPCPRCHPDPESLLTKVPRARASYEECLAMQAMEQSQE